MSYLRAGIVRLWEEGKKQSEIARDMNVPKQTVSDAIKRFRETGRNEHRARSGQPATATTPSETVCFRTFISRAISLCFFPSSQSRTMPALRSDIQKHGIYWHKTTSDTLFKRGEQGLSDDTKKCIYVLILLKKLALNFVRQLFGHMPYFYSTKHSSLAYLGTKPAYILIFVSYLNGFVWKINFPVGAVNHCRYHYCCTSLLWIVSCFGEILGPSYQKRYNKYFPSKLTSPICFNIYRRKSTEDISSFPFILGFLSGTLWLRYGILIGDFAMITCNTVAISLMIFYLVFYTYYTQPKLSILVKIAVDVVFIALILTVVQIFEESAREPLGFVSMIFNAINFGAPLGGLAVVLRTRSCETLPLPMCIFNLLVSSEWLLYGFVIKDKYLIIPNSAGVALALIQISFFLVLPRAPGKTAPLGYCCSCVRNLQIKQVEKPSKQDLAKNGHKSTWKRPKVGDVNANEVTINVIEHAENKSDVKLDVVDE